METCLFPPGFGSCCNGKHVHRGLNEGQVLTQDDGDRHDNPSVVSNLSVTEEVIEEGEKTESFVAETVEDLIEVNETRWVCEDGGLFLLGGNDDVLLRDLVDPRKTKEIVEGGRGRGRRRVILAAPKRIIQATENSDGGILCSWRKELFDCELVRKRKKWITMKGVLNQTSFVSVICTIYGPHIKDEKLESRKELIKLKEEWEIQLLVCEMPKIASRLGSRFHGRRLAGDMGDTLFRNSVVHRNNKIFSGQISVFEEMFRDVWHSRIFGCIIVL
ncbi:hypothetical protein PIB30_046884 [Stylosanthes scabra]|uniref:Uncharacterized protein n=1 Tax=Stylosanthes scabra TaxID=79078 RepID=A0ABU6TIH7_9FABA|nr:hypothetical protein [Stylosanthes scabra]